MASRRTLGKTPYQRAMAIIDRAMPDKLAVRDGRRWLRVDVTYWKRSLARRFASRLRGAR